MPDASSALLAVLRDAVLVVDDEGRVTDCNPAAEILFGLPRDGIVGVPAAVMYGMAPDSRERRDAVAEIARAGGWMGDVELAATPTRAAATVNVHITALRDDAGRLTGGVAVIRDVTAQRAGEAESRRLRAEVQKMLEVAPIGLCLTGVDGRVMQVNQRLCQILGREAEELTGMTYQEFTHPDDVPPCQEQVRQLMAGEVAGPFEQEKRYLRGDGSEVWARVTAALMRDDAGVPTHFVTAIEDITERRRVSERMAAIAAAQLAIADVELSPQKVMHEICRRAQELTGADAAAVQMLEDDHLVVRASCGTLTRVTGLRLALDGISGPAVREGRVMTSADAVHDPRVSQDASRAARRGRVRAVVVAPLRSGDEVLGVLTVTATRAGRFTEEDAQALALLAAPVGTALANAWRLESTARQATTDPLTGLPNRTRLLLSLDEAMLRLPAGDGRLALLFLDLDGFKAVNDARGHEAGDRVLREVADRIGGVVRARDIAGRLGGDEFCVVCTDLTTGTDAESLARRLVEAVAGEYPVGPGETATIGISIGVAVTDTAIPPGELLRTADELMYAAKQSGGNRYCVGTAG